MAGRPAKTAKVLQMGNSHHTKAEFASRERQEREMLTGDPIREDDATRQDPIAHKEFLRVTKLLRKIDKDDDMYGAEINLYCQLKSEIAKSEAERARLYQMMETADDPKVVVSISTRIGACDRMIQDKRKMMISIDDKNLMNVASALRCVVKADTRKKNPLAEALGQ